MVKSLWRHFLAHPYESTTRKKNYRRLRIKVRPTVLPRPHTLGYAMAVPRHTPRRAVAADDVTMETYFNGRQSILI